MHPLARAVVGSVAVFPLLIAFILGVARACVVGGAATVAWALLAAAGLAGLVFLFRWAASTGAHAYKVGARRHPELEVGALPPPSGVVTPPPHGAGDLASPRQRIAAWILDAAIVGTPIAYLLLALYGSDPGYGEVLLGNLVGLLLVVIYLVASDAFGGATLGKRIVGIRVTDAFGRAEHIGVVRAVRRRAWYFVGALALYIGWLSGLGNESRQTWHDKAARTVVIRAR